ncbi:MAG TPA: hypothetical protein PKK61_00720 [Defluviitaleaceae bacterium]|jgi:hypothetical protein|nr:hypothetical protein [Candidatus Epulonipiscium sp.]HOA79574.1 hypothetical protein [Defluviitaleaceae bacterium]
MNKRGYIIVVGLLSLFVLLTACANNRMARNGRDDDGIFDNGNGIMDNNGRVDDGLGYDNDLDLSPADLNTREDNVRRGITTQIPNRTLPNIMNDNLNNALNRNNTTNTTTRNNTTNNRTNIFKTENASEGIRTPNNVK